MNELWTWVRFAWHNCLRNLRRSLVTTAIAMLGTAAILLAGGFALFTYDSLAQASARDTGHLVLGTPAHFAQDEDVPLQNGLDAVAALRGTLLADPAVRHVLPRVAFSGLVSNGDKSVVMLAQGVEPDSEFAVKGPFLTVRSGHLLESGAAQPQVMLGDDLARSLKAGPGSSLTLLASTTEGAMNAIDVVVTGTLSGAPKIKAMELISGLEPTDRGYYGGAIGFIGMDGSFNHAIMIRTLLSRHNKLTYQAGAGVVAASKPENELQEVNNKLGALKKAIEAAEQIQ